MSAQNDSRETGPGFPHRFSTSGWMTPAIIGILCLGLVLGSFEHTRGNIHHLRETVGTHPPPAPTGPGGQDVAILSRNLSHGAGQPQFISATFFPGRGFNLWQLTASLPGVGQVPLLFAPSVDVASDLLSGDGADSNGSVASRYGAAFSAPWAAVLSGYPAPAAGMLQSLWNDQRLTFPSETAGGVASTEGLLLNRAADSVAVHNIPDGQATQAIFHAGSFSGGWASSTDISVSAELTGESLVLSMTAQNVGSAPEPFGLGWEPHFVIPSGDRAHALLVVPSVNRLDGFDPQTGLPLGKVASTVGTPQNFDKAEGTPLGNLSLDSTYLDLHTGTFSDGPIAELRDPKSGFGLRLIPLSRSITSLHVTAPATQNWVSIAPNTNLPDPLGRQWSKIDSTGIVILQPGDKLEWKVRLEIFSTTNVALPPATPSAEPSTEPSPVQ